MDRFHAMAVFAKVVEQGSFARAADRLDLSTSAVSRHLADLESHLGVRLLNRTTRRLSLTESGQAFHERVVQLLADLEEAETAVTATAVSPRGTLKLTCAIAFGERYLAPVIADFIAKHPLVRFEVDLSDRTVDLVEEGFDLAVRIGALASQTLIARRIAQAQLVCCASPAYLAKHGTPSAPDDLTRHRCLEYAYMQTRGVWTFRDAAGRERRVHINGPVYANNGGFLGALAAQHVAIAFEPDFLVGDDIRAGRLVPLLREFTAPAIPIYAVYPSRRHLSAKVRAFVDFLAERFAPGTPWSLGDAKRTTSKVRSPERR